VLETQNLQRLRIDPHRHEAIGEPELVTRGSRFWSSPDPSPDGERVVMYSQVRPEGDLYVINADGTGLRQLTSDQAVDRVPRWSPDGQWIATFSNRSGRLGVWKLRVDGSEQQLLTGDTVASVAAWSPDGARLAVTRGGAEPGPGARSFIVDATRGVQNAVLDELPDAPNLGSAFVTNSWAPDGTKIAGQNGFARVGVSVYTIATGAFSRVAEFGEWPVWLPDSRHVLVVSRGREFQIIDTVERTSKRIFSVLRDTLGPPRLTRDGRSAYFSRRATEADVWLVDLSPE
jgi:Tol biopolymer transport system component